MILVLYAATLFELNYALCYLNPEIIYFLILIMLTVKTDDAGLNIVPHA